MRAVVTVAVCLALWAPSARAADSGEALRQEGMRQYDAGHYDAAIAKLGEAYAATHDAAILYALGQAKRRRGDCRGAIDTFERFIASNPPTSAVGAARFQIARCLEQLAKTPEPAQPPPSATTTPPPTASAPSTAPPPAPPRRRWYKDAAGDALFGVGVAALASGAALFGVAEARARDAGVDLASYRDAESVGALRTAAIVVTSAGAVVVAGAVARWLVAGRSHQRDTAVPTNRPAAPTAQPGAPSR